jgi:CubicO group peptidase (beta-lactamase class C family)
MTVAYRPRGRRVLLGTSAVAGAIAAGLGGCASPTAGSAPAAPVPGGPVFSPLGARAADLVHDGAPQPVADRSTWFRTREAVDGFSRADAILPSTRVAAGRAAAPWRRPGFEPAIVYDGAAQGGGAGRFTIDQYLERNPVTALAISVGDELLVERYRYGRRDTHRFTSFSMAKTVVAILVGIAVAEGRIGSIEDPAERHVRDLAGTAYGRTPIRHLLTMSSGVAFRETYDGADDVSRLSRATVGGAGPGGAEAVRPFDRREAEPGQRFSYASAETYVLALVLARALGTSVADFTATHLWQPMGAEADASWLVDAGGNAVGYMGLNAVLRDYARLGRLLAEGGRAQGRQVVPADWLTEMTRAHFPPQATRGFHGYGFQTWIFPDGDGSFALQGVRGQSIFVDPRRRLVMAQTAVRPSSRDPGAADSVALWRGLRARF